MKLGGSETETAAKAASNCRLAVLHTGRNFREENVVVVEWSVAFSNLTVSAAFRSSNCTTDFVYSGHRNESNLGFCGRKLGRCEFRINSANFTQGFYRPTFHFVRPICTSNALPR